MGLSHSQQCMLDLNLNFKIMHELMGYALQYEFLDRLLQQQK